jgi:hypothetical protein
MLGKEHRYGTEYFKQRILFPKDLNWDNVDWQTMAK